VVVVVRVWFPSLMAPTMMLGASGLLLHWQCSVFDVRGAARCRCGRLWTNGKDREKLSTLGIGLTPHRAVLDWRHGCVFPEDDNEWRLVDSEVVPYFSRVKKNAREMARKQIQIESVSCQIVLTYVWNPALLFYCGSIHNRKRNSRGSK
jgi:hypothetical protein